MRRVVIDVDAPRHLKQVRAGDAACWLWVCGLAYCQQQLTDGVIPREVVPHLGATGDLPALATRLVEVGLWERHALGYLVHDYLVYQQSRDEQQAEARSRSEQARVAANVRWNAERMRRACSEQCSEHAGEHAQTMLSICPSTESLIKKKNDGQEAVAAPVPVPKPVQGKLHRGHAFCGERFCVPHFLHDEFDKQLGGSEVVDLFTWYPKVDARALQVGIIEDPLRFVRDEFRKALQGHQRHGIVAIHDLTTLDRCPHVPHCTSSRACQTLLDIQAAKEER